MSMKVITNHIIWFDSFDASETNEAILKWNERGMKIANYLISAY